MDCPYCGRKIADNSEYCAECGYPIEGNAYGRKRSGRQEQDRGINLSGRRLDKGLWCRRLRRAMHIGMWVLLWAVSLSIFAFAIAMTS